MEDLMLANDIKLFQELAKSQISWIDEMIKEIAKSEAFLSEENFRKLAIDVLAGGLLEPAEINEAVTVCVYEDAQDYEHIIEQAEEVLRVPKEQLRNETAILLLNTAKFCLHELFADSGQSLQRYAVMEVRKNLRDPHGSS